MVPRIVVVTFLVFGARVVLATGDASAASPTELTSCTFAALQSAIAGGGTIDYDQDCGTNFPSAIVSTEST